MSIEEYFGDWAKVIDVRMADSLLRKVITSKAPFCPEAKDVFRAFRLCHLKDLRVVIIGQDPYFNLKDGKPVATGIAFANRSDTEEECYSPSLEILRESVIDFTVPHGNIIFDPSLEKWEEQGVLMLNSALTCITGKPGSHTLLWRGFMKNLLINLSRQTVGIVYVLMGSNAQSLETYIDKNTNHIIKIRHPASYARNQERMPSEPWRQIDDLLIGMNGNGIEWYQEV